jgi:hypothetical protein
MASPLSGSLARTLGSALASTFLDATLTRTTAVAGTNPWDPPASTSDTAYSCKAIRDTFGATWLSGGLVDAEDVKIIVLASTLSVTPESGDRITLGGVTWTIVPAGSGKPAVSTDPATATWDLRCRK